MVKKKSARATQKLRSYPDLRDHIRALENENLLRVVDLPINKDTELFPLVRWQVRGGVPDEERKAWLFTNVTDSKGKKYDMPVLIGAWGGNKKIYSIGLGCPLEKSNDLWEKALSNPIPPREIFDASCQEIIIEGTELDQPGNALDALPVPISTPGWDNAPLPKCPTPAAFDSGVWGDRGRASLVPLLLAIMPSSRDGPCPGAT